MAPSVFMNAILDSLDAHIAVLDGQGTIVAVNEAWRAFGRENGLLSVSDGIGLNYLVICEVPGARPTDAQDGPAARIRAVLAGEIDSFQYEYPCPTPSEQLWFQMAVTALQDENERHVIVMHEDITSRKLAEIELQSSELHYRTLLTHVPGTVYLSDPADPARVIFEFARNWEYLDQDLVDLESDPYYWMKWVHPDDLPMVIENDRRAKETGEPFVIDYRHRTQNGEYIWLRDSGVLVRDDSGKPLHWMGIALDVTEQKQVELALSASEEYFRSAFEDASFAMTISALDGKFVQVNQSACELLQMPAEELLAQLLPSFIHPEDLPQAMIDRETLLAGDVPRLHVERRLVRRDGSVIRVLLGISKIHTITGETLLLTQVQDITERKAAEEQLREATETLQSVFHAAPIAIMVTDLNNQVIEWNPMAEELFGWTAEEAIGVPAPMIPVSEQEHAGSIRSRVLAGEVINGVTVQRRHKDGSLIDVSLSGAPIRAADGSVRGAMALFVDLRAQKIAEKARARRDRVLGMVSGTVGLSEILNALCDLVETEVQGAYSTILLLDESGQRLWHQGGTRLPAGFLGALDGEPIGPAAGSCGTAVFLKQPVLVSDIESDPLWAAYREVAARAGLRSCWAVPILSDQNTALGSFAVYSQTVRHPTDQELEAMLGASHLARIAIERKMAEERVRESEQQFRSAFEGAATGVAFVGFDGTFLRVNPALCELVGYSAEELMGRNYRDVTHPDDVGMSEETGDLVADGRARSVEFEKRYIHRDGHIVWVQMTSSIIRDDAGQALYHITQMHDVTPRKRAEEALSQSEQRFRGLIQHASDMIGIIDSNMTIVYESSAIESALGHRVDDIVGRNALEYLHPDEVDDILELLGGLTVNPESHVPLTYRCLHNDGSWRWLEATVTNLLHVPGIQGFVINARDVTDRVLAESLIHESEERFRSAFEDAAIGMAIMGLDDRIQRVNNAVCELSGYTAEELIGRNGFELSHPEDAGIAQPQMAALVNGDIKSFRIERRYLHRDGSTIWALVNVSAVLDAAGRPSYLIAQIQDITERKQLEQSLHHQAFHDMLTGLPNRALLLERIRAATDHKQFDSGFVGLLYLDLDNFKIVNDSLGHLAGDKLLMQLAERLQACVREGDTVSRLGGDEFAILLPSLSSITEALDIADRVIAAFEQPLVVVGRPVNTSTSIGVVIAEPQDTPDDLLRQADVAMYRAKARGKNCIELFDAEMHADALRRLEVENDLRRAIDQHEFVVHYQPKIDLHEQRVYGLEALVRWNHPERGLLPPAYFISLAEETGLIVPLGRFVLHDACQQARRLLDSGLLQQDSVMSLNISGRQFSDPGLVDVVAEAMASAGLDPGKLILEMTETVLMDDIEESAVRLEALAALGVGIAIDDFGTGYSSLSYLRRFPISVLKIDRSFVSRLGISTADTAIVTAVISLADALLIHAVAEGVETPEQLEHLQRLGCHLAQGFYFSRPLPVDQLETFLSVGVESWAAYI